jgi:hypothetical protein
MKADEAVEIYGLQLEADKVVEGDEENQVVSYQLKSAQKVLLRTNYWNDRMNYYPISRKETFKNRNLVQNPGW